MKSDHSDCPAYKNAGLTTNKHARWRTLWRVAGWTVVSIYFVFITLVAITRYWLFPHIEQQIPFIEQQIENATQTSVEIGHLRADWDFINPRLTIENLTLARPGHDASLTLPSVEATLSWRTLYRFAPSLSRLVILDPKLKVKRLSETTFDVAGFEIDTQPKTPSDSATPYPNKTIVHWLESQDHIEITNGQFEYTDLTQKEVRTLRITDTNFLLHQHLIAWSLGFQAKLASETVHTPIDVRAKIERKVFGDSLDPDTWSGRFFVNIDQVDFRHVAKHIGMQNLVESGFGQTQFWLEFENQKLTKLTADLVLDNIKLRLSENHDRILLDHLSGRFEETLDGNRFELKTSDVIVTPHGQQAHYLGDVTVGGRWAGQMLHNGNISLALVDIHTAALFAQQLPLPSHVKNMLRHANPRGLIENVQLQWEGPLNAPTDYSASARFEALSINDDIVLPDSDWQTPGFKNLSGLVEIENGKGALVLDASRAVLSFPGIFVDKDLAFDTLKVEAEWEFNPHFAIRFNKIIANNDHASANVKAGWEAIGGPYGTLEVKGDIHYLKANEIYRYIPIVAGGKATNDWLKAALRNGIARDGKVNLYGPLHLFPYTDPTQNYIFQITAHAEGLELDYVPSHQLNEAGEFIPGQWPLITDIKGFLDFKGMGFEIKAQTAKTMGTTLTNVYACIANYLAENVPLELRGQAEGPLQQMGDWVNASPISNMIGDVFVDSTATGNASLNLALDIPILKSQDTRVQGEVTISGNSLHLKNVPPLTDAHGVVSFSERGVWATALQAKVHGVDTIGSIRTDEDGKITIFANALTTVEALDKIIDVPIVSNILTMAEGSADAHVEVTIKNGVNIHVDSNLEGLAFKAPAPLNKLADETMPMTFDMGICSTQAKNCQPKMTLNIGSLVNMDLRYNTESDGMHLSRGAIGINQTVQMPKQDGISLQMTLPNAQWAQWDPVLDRLLQGIEADDGKPATSAVTLNNIRLKTNSFSVQDFYFKNLTMNADLNALGSWQGSIVSDVAQGNFVWTPLGAARRPHLEANFKRLHVTASKIVNRAIEKVPENPADLPSLDVKIDDLRYDGYQLGEVELLARNRGHGPDFTWEIANLTVRTPEATLLATGNWNAGLGDRSETNVEATLDVRSLGDLLSRAQVPQAVKDGHGQIHVQLNWPGSPTQFTVNHLNGSISTALASGQILQVEPGAARLLSLLSMQSLLRRLTLDFRDVVGQGFVFDTINSLAKIQQGVLFGDSFRLVGPQATVLIGGEVDFNRYTQNLQVTVLPEISLGGATLALTLANPIVGVSSFLAQLALQAPLSQLFSMEYTITGTFDEPIIEKTEKNTTIPSTTPQ